MVDGVVGGIRRPASGESIDHGAIRQDRAQFGCTCAPLNGNKVTAVSEDPEKDDEDDGGGDPRPEFVGVHDFVAECGDAEGADGDDDNADGAFDVAVDCLDELGADDRVDGRPADAGQDVENGDWTTRSASVSQIRGRFDPSTYSVSLRTIHTRSAKGPSDAYCCIVSLENRSCKTREHTHNPNAGPKVEKKQTGVIPIKLKNKITSIASPTPMTNKLFANNPSAKLETTMFADSHMVDTFSNALKPESVRSSSGTRSMPRCSMFSFPAKRCAVAYQPLPTSKLSPGTAWPSSAWLLLRSRSTS